MLQESRCLRQYLNERPEKAGLRLLQAHFRIGKYSLPALLLDKGFMIASEQAYRR